MRVAPALVGQAIITFAGKDLGATINGIIPDLMRHVSTIDEHFIAGSLETLATNPDGIVLGSGLPKSSAPSWARTSPSPRRLAWCAP